MNLNRAVKITSLAAAISAGGLPLAGFAGDVSLAESMTPMKGPLKGIALPKVAKLDFPHTIVDGEVVIGGDISLGPVAQVMGRLSRDNARAEGSLTPYANPGQANDELNGLRWHNGIVPYVIATGFSAAAVAQIEEAMQWWQDAADVNFVLRTESNAGRYGSYVVFRPAGKCMSRIGRVGGSQAIHLDPNGCFNRTGVAAHEIGHALGLWHEHQRPDRSDYILFDSSVLADGADRHQWSTTPYWLGTTLGYGPYDYASVMHYGAYSGSATGDPVLTPLDPSVDINSLGRYDRLTPGDVAGVNGARLHNNDMVTFYAHDGVSRRCYVTARDEAPANQWTTPGAHALIESEHCREDVNTRSIWDFLLIGLFFENDTAVADRWHFTDHGYIINSKGMCLTTQAYPYYEVQGGPTMFAQCENDMAEQQWEVLPSGQIRQAIWEGNDLCLTVNHASNGTRLRNGPCLTPDSHMFDQQLAHVDSKPNTMRPYLQRDRLLSYESGSIGTIAEKDDSTWWVLQRAGGEDVFRIWNPLDYKQYLAASGSSVSMQELELRDTRTRWEIIEVADAMIEDELQGQVFYIRSVSEPRVYLQFDGSTTIADTTHQPTAAHRWIFEQIHILDDYAKIGN